MQENTLRPGLRPRLRWGSLQRSPGLLAGVEGGWLPNPRLIQLIGLLYSFPYTK